MSDLKMPRWQCWAQFRFAVIGGLLSSPPERGQLQQDLKVLAEKSYQHPLDADKQLMPSFSAIERWYYKAKDAPDPISALGQKLRADAGRRWAIGEPLKAAIEAQYRAYPRWTVQLHYDNLVVLSGQQTQLPPLPSYKTVLRCMRENGWNRRCGPLRPTEGQSRAQRRREQREVRSYEVSHVHALWHLDFHHAKIRLLDEFGNWYRPIALAILDDRSRLCCHLQFYLAETAECLIHGLTQAIMKRGLPRALMTDNGSAMLAEETTQGLLRLGVVHETTLPYSPYQNGKQEVFWAQLEGRLVEMLRGIENLKLAFINHAAQAWIEQDYHRNQHREIGTTPLQRMLDGPDVGRRAPDADTMRLAFTRQITRTPRRGDATVVVEGVRYELPPRFGHLRTVTLRSPSWDKSQMTLVDPKTGGPVARLLPQDKAKNASGMRRTIESPVTASTADLENKPMPALLQKWLADYAASGLPPAYLPKEEYDHD
ncbi:MAG: DDE-type integrase/transposase/recombinase [Syntrophus sp. (in: bacteria)]